MEFWKQITFGAGGTGLLGVDDVVEVVTVAAAGARAVAELARAGVDGGFAVAGAASSANA
jgi:hypothetical protein